MSTETMDAGAKSAKELAGTRMPSSGLARIQVTTFKELVELSNILANSDIVPKDLRAKPANVLLVLMYGNEIGITPAQALQNVMVVNGRPSLWGDAVMGLCEASREVESWRDWADAANGGTHYFATKRKGRPEVVRSFSMADAAKAKLDKKEGPWQEYPKRMLFHRARSWGLRDVYPDVLKGIRYFEEERDVISLERRDGEKEYAMPKENATASIPAEKIDGAKPVEAAPAAIEKKTDGEIVEFKVHSVSKSDFGGEPCFCIRDKSEPAVKYFTDNEAHATLAKSVKESGASVGGVWIEKVAGDAKGRWLLALQLKA